MEEIYRRIRLYIHHTFPCIEIFLHQVNIARLPKRQNILRRMPNILRQLIKIKRLVELLNYSIEGLIIINCIWITRTAEISNLFHFHIHQLAVNVGNKNFPPYATETCGVQCRERKSRRMESSNLPKHLVCILLYISPLLFRCTILCVAAWYFFLKFLSLSVDSWEPLLSLVTLSASSSSPSLLSGLFHTWLSSRSPM